MIEIFADGKVDTKGDKEICVKGDKASIEGTSETEVKSSTIVKTNAPTVETNGTQSVAIKAKTVDLDGKAVTNIKGGVLNFNM